VDYRILGPLEIVDADGDLPLGGAKQRALLAVLLLYANEVVPIDRLVDALWGERPPRTAVNTLQVMVWRCRKLLPDGALITRPPGYALRAGREEVDLFRFEDLVGRARTLAPADAAAALAEAVALWRGPALADLSSEGLLGAEAGRLEELQLRAIEEHVEAELALGHHEEQVAPLVALTASHPFRERLRGQLMRALHSSGRRADALDVFQQARRTLVDELGIEPGQALRELHAAILQGDLALDAPATTAAQPDAAGATDRTILLALGPRSRPQALIALAAPMATTPQRRELLLARLLAPGDGAVAEASQELDVHRRALVEAGTPARSAAFTSPDGAADLARLASQQDADLLLFEVGPDEVARASLPQALRTVLGGVPCDVGLYVPSAQLRLGPDRRVVVPFGAGAHDWAALELAAWAARAHDAPLALVGTAAGSRGRDASRLLADASLLVQRWLGISAEPVLAEPRAVPAATRDAGLVVVGVSDRWSRDGIGRSRVALVQEAQAATVLVRRGIRPGGLAPPETLTRFTWSMAQRPAL